MSVPEDKTRSGILSRCISIDLEIDPDAARIFSFAAVSQDVDASGLVVNEGVEASLRRLYVFCQGFDHVIGHNIF